MRTLLIINFVVFCNILTAQSTFRPSLYIDNLNFYNPASGWENEMQSEASVYLQHKWVDQSNLFIKPTNIFVNYLSNTKNNKHHFSLSYTFDKFSYLTRNKVNGGYAHTIEFDNSGKLTFGARASLSIDAINGDKIIVPTTTNLTTNHLVPDFDFGIDYNLKGFHVAFGTKNIFASEVKIENETLYSNQRFLSLNLSYEFLLAEKFGITPLAMLYLDRKPGIDAGLNLNFYEIVEATYIFRLTELRHIGAIGINVTNRFYFGIAADRSQVTSDINTDFNLRFRF